ncbi:MAG: hypothetical protein U1F67_16260 [Rubrivivax sp.]
MINQPMVEWSSRHGASAASISSTARGMKVCAASSTKTSST